MQSSLARSISSTTVFSFIRILLPRSLKHTTINVTVHCLHYTAAMEEFAIYLRRKNASAPFNSGQQKHFCFFEFFLELSSPQQLQKVTLGCGVVIRVNHKDAAVGEGIYGGCLQLTVAMLIQLQCRKIHGN